MTAAPVARTATATDVDALAALAAETFPLACPPGTDPEAIRAHIRDRLGTDAIAGWLGDPAATVVVVNATIEEGEAARLDGYALVLTGACGDPEAALALAATGVDARRIHELSKIYVRMHAQGTGTAATLMTSALETARRTHGGDATWLGTNASNARAQAFYRRHGFEVVGTRTYRVGGQEQADVVMLRP